MPEKGKSPGGPGLVNHQRSTFMPIACVADHRCRGDSAIVDEYAGDQRGAR